MKSGFVSLIGRPNAGKSTLLNQLIGEKIAIVSDKPQTTRTRILGVRTDAAGQMVFLDTPGIHRPLHRMNVRMVDQALDAIGTVDVLVLVVDAATPPGGGDRFLLDRIGGARAPVILALNKIDLVTKPSLLPLIEWYRTRRPFAAVVPLSAKTGDGVDLLVAELVAGLPEGEPLYPPDYLTDQPERVLAAELVREQVLQHTADELPFTTGVVLDQFDDQRSRGLLRLFASIYVEQPSQKAIVIGRGGAMIRRIGSAARAELERLFDARVYLELHVKVRPRWRDDERVLDEMGVSPRRR